MLAITSSCFTLWYKRCWMLEKVLSLYSKDYIR